MAARARIPCPMSKYAALLLTLVALAAAAGLWVAQRYVQSSPSSIKPLLPAPRALTLFATPRDLPAFSLQQADGTALTPDALKGHWTLVFLGFTHCPDVCPTTLAQLAGAQTQWAALPALTRPRLLFVSADPQRDSPQQVASYAHAFHPDTLAATAPLPQLEAFARSLSCLLYTSRCV